MKIELEDGLADVIRSIGISLSQDEAYGYLLRLLDDGIIDARTFKMMQAAVSRNTLAIDLPVRDLLRARIFRALLSAYFSVSEDRE